VLADEGRRSLHPLQMYIIENKISPFLGGALCWRRPQPSDKTEAFRAIRFNRVAILRYTQGTWILTGVSLLCEGLLSVAREVLFARARALSTESCKFQRCKLGRPDDLAANGLVRSNLVATAPR